jgi:cytochrome c oxidase cbb3-type subunit 4
MLQTIYEWANNLWGLWLMVLFVGIVAWVYWPGRKREIEAHGRIPLDDDR